SDITYDDHIKGNQSAKPLVNAMCASILALMEQVGHSKEVVDSLKLSGHTVVVCKNFFDAICILQGNKPSLIISDVHLENGGNVFDFLRWVRQEPLNRDTPFVLFSCTPTPLAKYLDDGLKTSARLLGATQYIAVDKFDPEHFRNQIDAILPAAMGPVVRKGANSVLLKKAEPSLLGERKSRNYCRVGSKIYYGRLEREFRLSPGSETGCSFTC
ncbi:MAG: response regulator, partial [Cyanobacteria bacterium SZAS LIN-2]|nr:response regulator [Cyanobacteria bacterium SZAS LIN-2]